MGEKRKRGGVAQNANTQRKYIYIKYKNINIYNKYIFFYIKFPKLEKNIYII